MDCTESDPVIVVGGGPAGMMAGLLLARAGIPVTVLEKHGDFLRDFRGDTVHPSTLEIFHQLGMLERLLQIPHSRVEMIGVRIAGREWGIADFRHLPVAAPFIAMMPQWDLLNFIAKQGARYPAFRLVMEAEAVGVTMDEAGRASGVRLRDGRTMDARLVVAADGRRSVLREAMDLPTERLGAPMDVFWFRLDKPNGMRGDTFGALDAGRFLVLIDRRDYFQCAFPFIKGHAEQVRNEGLHAFRDSIASLVPELSDAVRALTSWDDIKLLDVALDRLTRWHCPGFIAIGDAAHAMSPIGGVGINVAVQDAVALANHLALPLAEGEDIDLRLPEVQASRWTAVTRMQALQKLAQDKFIEPTLQREKPLDRAPFPVRLLDRVAYARRLPGRIIGMGFKPVKVRSFNVYGTDVE